MPYTLADLPFFLVLPALLVASGFFSGSETAMFALSAHQRYRMARSGTLTGRAASSLLSDQRALLVTLMLGNMTINVLFFVVSSALLIELEGAALNPVLIAAASLVPLLAIIIFGEVLPKLIANTARPAWVRATALPLLGFHRAIKPLGLLVARWLVHPLGRLFAPAPMSPRLETAEIDGLLEMSEQRGVIGADEQQLLRQVLQIGRQKVRDVMVPRVDIRHIDVHRPPRELRRLIDETGLSKVVAVDDDLDHVLGVIYAREFLLSSRGSAQPPLRKLVRSVRFVPELQRVDDLLAEFRKTGTKLAIAVDEYGGTAGLVTLKDLVEQMVGDLDMDQAPGEAPGTAAEPIGPGAWRVSGRLSVHDWTEAFAAHGLQLPPRVVTLGGLIMTLLGRVPKTGDEVRLGNLRLTVERMEQGRVESAVLRIGELPDGAPPSEPTDGEPLA